MNRSDLAIRWSHKKLALTTVRLKAGKFTTHLNFLLYKDATWLVCGYLNLREDPGSPRVKWDGKNLMNCWSSSQEYFCLSTGLITGGRAGWKRNGVKLISDLNTHLLFLFESYVITARIIRLYRAKRGGLISLAIEGSRKKLAFLGSNRCKRCSNPFKLCNLWLKLCGTWFCWKPSKLCELRTADRSLEIERIIKDTTFKLARKQCYNELQLIWNPCWP